MHAMADENSEVRRALRLLAQAIVWADAGAPFGLIARRRSSARRRGRAATPQTRSKGARPTSPFRRTRETRRTHWKSPPSAGNFGTDSTIARAVARVFRRAAIGPAKIDGL